MKTYPKPEVASILIFETVEVVNKFTVTAVRLMIPLIFSFTTSSWPFAREFNHLLDKCDSAVLVARAAKLPQLLC
jgi:hypothetical protein